MRGVKLPSLFLNIITKMLSSRFRISLEPSKTLLWLWLKNSLSQITGEVGVDLAGGSMINKIFFKTEKYICVDINKIKLDEGKNKNPDAEIVNVAIMDYLNTLDFHPDLIVCVQTMGVNALFDHKETLEVIHQMYKKLKVGGSMVFNIGSIGVDIKNLDKELSIFFKDKFERVDSRFYGAFNIKSGPSRWKVKKGFIVSVDDELKRNKKINENFSLFLMKRRFQNIYSLILAFLMDFFAPLRTAFGTKKNQLFFYCDKKL